MATPERIDEKNAMRGLLHHVCYAALVACNAVTATALRTLADVPRPVAAVMQRANQLVASSPRWGTFIDRHSRAPAAQPALTNPPTSG